MALMETIVALGLGVVQLLVGLVLAIASIYIGLSMFGKFTKGINEMEELKKGNVAVGILQAAIILAIANVIQSGVGQMTAAFMSIRIFDILSVDGLTSVLIALIKGLAQLLVGILFAVISIWMAIKVLDKITKGIDEMEELKKGNVAVAILMAGVLLAVSFVVQAGVAGLANAIGVAI